MLLKEVTKRSPRPKIVFPPIHVDLTGLIAATGAERPDCPVCGGYLDFCQPGEEASNLVGSCVHCERLSFVLDAGGAMPIVLLLPTLDEVAAKAFGAIASA